MLTRIARRLHQRQRRGVDQVPGLGPEADVEADEVGPGEQLGQWHQASAELGLERRVDRGSGRIDDLHPEASRAPRDGLPDPPKADDSERRPVDVRAEQEHRPPRRPLPSLHEPRRLGDPAGGSQDQGEGEIGRRLGQRAGGVADGNAPGGTGGHVDVVVANGVVADDEQPGSRPVEQLVVDPVREQGQDSGTALDRGQQLGPARRQVAVPDPGLGHGADRIEAAIRDSPGDEDPWSGR